MTYVYYLIQDSLTDRYYSKYGWVNDSNGTNISKYISLTEAKKQFKYICKYYGLQLPNIFGHNSQMRWSRDKLFTPFSSIAGKAIAKRLKIIKIEVTDEFGTQRSVISARLKSTKISYTALDKQFKTPEASNTFIANCGKNYGYYNQNSSFGDQIDLIGQYKNSVYLLSMGCGSGLTWHSWYSFHKTPIDFAYLAIAKEHKKQESDLGYGTSLFTLEYNQVFDLKQYKNMDLQDYKR